MTRYLGDGLLEPGIHSGVVKWFDNRENKLFGFIICESGKEIFFHFNDGEIGEAGQHSIEWSIPNKNSKTVLDYPKKGDRLYFEIIQRELGPIASPWTSEKYYKKAESDLFCLCGHHVQDHYCGSPCERCECPNFGEPTENWEEYTEVNLGDGPGGFKAYE